MLQRTTRRVALTEAGERYLLRCNDILDDIAEAEAEARDARAHPCGRLRMHAMPGIGQYYMVSAIAGYRQQYPTVQFDLTLSNRMPDLLEEGYDVCVVVARQLPDSGLVAQRIGETFSILCASAEYISRRGLPQHPEELRQYDCLGLVSSVLPLSVWTFEGPEGEISVPLPPTGLQVNVGDAVVQAIRSGMGIGVVPHYSAAAGLKDGSLVHVLPQFHLQPLHVYALYPSRRYLDAKVRTWVDYLQQTLPAALRADTQPEIQALHDELAQRDDDLI